ncbi:dynactin p62 family-domain-containing protein [Globomyces pollinis-pini]|nr:dynactin p62 family-domain-containing protein [Globomyces pollinis-pini]
MMELKILYKCECGSNFALGDLLYCPECKMLRCSSCISESHAFAYCPSCLFEVPSATVKAEHGCCSRNCFKCPICISPLLVIANSTNDNVPVTGHILACVYCGWDSNEIGLVFERPTGLTAQIHKLDSDRPDLKEFEQLKQYYDGIERNNRSIHPASSNSSLNSLFASKSFSHLGFLSTAMKSKPDTTIESYTTTLTDIHHEWDETKLFHELNLQDTTTIDQRISQSIYGLQHTKISQIRPLRVPLRTRKLKKCLHCQEILIKPEPKAQSYSFLIKQIASNWLPRYVVKRSIELPLKTNQVYEIQLQLFNGTSHDMRLEISIVDQMVNENHIQFKNKNVIEVLKNQNQLIYMDFVCKKIEKEYQVMNNMPFKFSLNC